MELADKLREQQDRLGGHPEDCAAARFQIKQLCLDNLPAIIAALEAQEALVSAPPICATCGQPHRPGFDCQQSGAPNRFPTAPHLR